MNSKRLFSIAGNRFAVAAIAATVAGIFPGADRVGAQLLIPDWDLDHIVYLDVPTGETSVYAGVPAGSSPHHVAVDAQGRLYVSVRYRDMNVLRLTPDGAGGWTTENFTGTIGDFGPGELLFDADGHLVVSGDRPARVFRYDTTTGALVDSFTRSGANVLNAAAIDGDKLYVIEVFRSFLVEFDLSRNPVTSRVVLTDTERLERSGDVTLVAPGRVLISSTRNPTVQEYSLPEGNFVRTFLDVRSLGEETAGNITYVPHLDRYYLVRGNKVHELGPDGELLRTIVSDHLQNGTRAELLPDAIPDQTIDFPQPPNRTYGDPDFDLVATASSGLPVTFTLVSGPATLSGATVSITGAGEVVVRAGQPGDAETGPAPPVERTFVIEPLPATVTVTDAMHVFDGTPREAVVETDPPGLQVVVTYDGSPAAPTDAGSYAVVATVVDPIHAGSGTGGLVISRAGQTIDFEAPSDRQFGDPPAPLLASATSGLEVSFSVVAGPAILVGGTLGLTGAGSVTVRASQSGGPNHEAAPDVDRTFTVAPGDQTLTFPPMADRPFARTPFVPAATASSGLPVSFEVVSGPAFLFGGQVTLTDTGSVTLRALQDGSADWLPAPPVERTFTVVRAPQSVIFPPPGDRALDGGAFTLAATATSGLPVAFSVVAGPATLEGGVLTPTGAGAVAVRASQAGDSRYLAAPPVDRSVVFGYRLALEPGEGGGITAAPEKAVYAPGEEVVLTAREPAGHRFTGWTGDLSGNESPSVLTMDAHRSVGAEFRRIRQLTVTAGAHGSVVVSPAKAEYLEGDVVTLTPIPDPGYALESWGGDASGSEVPLALTLAADTVVSATFADVTGPTVRILAPAPGTTNNQFGALVGTVTDNESVASVRWVRDGEPEGPLELAGGAFGIADLILRPGENRFAVLATDTAGNVGSQEVVVRWAPDRTFSLGGPVETREGGLVVVPLTFESGGEVAGMTFTLTHDPRWLGAPRLELSELVTAGIHQINAEVPGETRVTFSLPATTLPPGLRSLGTASFRVRSVPSDLETPIGLAAPDVSAAGGGQLPFGTFVAGAGVRIAPRTHTGDINTNDRLDTGDAFLMQRLLAGLDEVRAWDHALNDLNGSSVLDSGDVTRVLRAVVGIDPQPGARGMDARDGEPGGKSAHPATRLAFVGGIHHGSAGGTVTVQVRVDEIGYAPSGASFQLDYPAEALRLTGASSHRAGALVPDSALVLWNVTPDGDDDADQTGRLGFVASSATPWPGAEAGGVLAELTFEIQPAAAAQPSWDLRLHAAELPSSDGYSVLALPEAATVFVGQASAFDPWLASFLTEQQRSDPAFTGLDSDGDRDGRVALVEFGTGSHPMASDAPRGPRPRIISIGGERFGAVEFDRSLTALGISHTVQMTDGLGEWRDADDSDTVLHSRSHPPGAAHETLVVRERTPIGEGARARAFRIRFQLDGD